MPDPQTVVAGSTFSAQLVDPGNVMYLGARVEVPVTRAIVSFWQEAVLDGSTWTVELESPLDPGGYLLVWRTGDPEPPAYETFLPLLVLSVGSIVPATIIEDPPAVNRVLVTPTVADIAALERTRTVAEGSTEEITFTENTRPTASEVESLIQQAIDLVLVELPGAFPVIHYVGVRRAIALYTAMLIEGSYHREQIDEGSASLWRTLYNTSMLNLQRKIISDLENWRRLRMMEPRSPRVLV